MACRTDALSFSRTTAARARHVELHATAGLRDLSAAVAFRTRSRRAHDAFASTVSACGQVRNRQLHYRPANRVPEPDVHLVFKVCPALRLLLYRSSAASAEHAGKDVLESAATAGAGFSAPADEIGKIESAEVETFRSTASLSGAAGERPCTKSTRSESASARVGFRCCRINVVGIKAKLVVDFALFGIAQDVIGFGDLFEFLFRLLVPGIHVRMVFSGELTKSVADLLRRGVLLYAQRAVIIFLLRRCHSSIESRIGRLTSTNDQILSTEF